MAAVKVRSDYCHEYTSETILRSDSGLLVAAALAAAIVGCDSAFVNFDNGGPPTVSETVVTGASDASVTSLLNYTMPEVNAGNRRENAVVLIPAGDTPDGGWPVIGWGHGTVGVADGCAPSASDNLFGSATYLNLWLAAGYAIVAPDYEGLGSPGGHPYLHLDSEGRSINYAVAAAAEAFPELSSNYALLGYSQGGHAVIGAASLAEENPDITLVGAVALAPPSQVLAQGSALKALYSNTASSDEERVAAAIADLSFSALLAHGIETVLPEFDLDSIYGTNGQSLKALTESDCLPQIAAELATSVAPVLLAQNSVDSFISADDQDANLQTYFESVEPGNRALAAPLLLLQGLSDFTVFPDSTITLQTQLSEVSATDTDPILTTYIGVDHTGILQASFNDAAAFITARFASQ